MGLLSRKQLNGMKWRTAFVAVAILALFKFGPQLRSETHGRFGRHLLQDEGTEQNPSDPEEETKENKATGNLPPACDLEQEDFKRALKVYIKAQDAPESVKLTCEAKSKITKAYCDDVTDQYVP